MVDGAPLLTGVQELQEGKQYRIDREAQTIELEIFNGRYRPPVPYSEVPWVDENGNRIAGVQAQFAGDFRDESSWRAFDAFGNRVE